METKQKSSTRISAKEVKARQDRGEKFTFIDVRNAQAWTDSDCKIPDSLRIPLSEFWQALPSIPRTEPIVTYCT